MVDTATTGQDQFLSGEYSRATLPSASANKERLAWVTDCPNLGVMWSDGTNWNTLSKRVETYSGTTNASGDYSVVFTTPYAATPHVNPVCYPDADSTTRVRVTAASNTGFTVKTEKNNTVTVLSLDVLALGTANVPSTPVRVLVVES